MLFGNWFDGLGILLIIGLLIVGYSLFLSLLIRWLFGDVPQVGDSFPRNQTANEHGHRKAA